MFLQVAFAADTESPLTVTVLIGMLEGAFATLSLTFTFAGAAAPVAALTATKV